MPSMWVRSFWRRQPSLVTAFFSPLVTQTDAHIDPQRAKKLASNVIDVMTQAGLTPSCHPLFAVIRLYQELLIASLSDSPTQEALDETIRTSAKYVAGLSAMLPAGHPVRGVALAELGKLLAVDELTDPSAKQFPPSGPARLRLARETLVQARAELLIGFGAANAGGMVGREVREAIVRLENELGAWAQGMRNALEDARAAAPRIWNIVRRLPSMCSAHTRASPSVYRMTDSSQ